MGSGRACTLLGDKDEAGSLTLPRALAGVLPKLRSVLRAHGAEELLVEGSPRVPGEVRAALACTAQLSRDGAREVRPEWALCSRQSSGRTLCTRMPTEAVSYQTMLVLVILDRDIHDSVFEVL